MNAGSIQHASAPEASRPVTVANPPGALRVIGMRLLLLAISLSIGLGFIEIALRIVGAKPKPPQYGDATLGFISKPNLTETFVFPEYGGPLTMKTNNMGFHEDTDTSIVKQVGSTRIVAIGDSQTAGECANDESYPNRFESELNSTPGAKRFEVINAGAGRYSPYQYYVKTTHQLLPLKPDHLIVGLYLGNDFMDLIRHDDRPYLTRKANGELEAHTPDFMMYEDPGREQSTFGSIRTLSFAKQALGPTLLYQMHRAQMLWNDAANEHRTTSDVVRYMWEVKKLTDISLGFMTQSLLQQVWFRRFPKSLDNALEMNRYVMTQFQQACRQNGVRLTYVLVPTKLLIEPEDMTGVLERVKKYNSGYTLDRLQNFENGIADRVLRDCGQLGISAIDLRQPMREQHGKARLYYPDEMHLNPAGNRVIAHILNGAMAQQLNASDQHTTARQ